MTLQNFPYSYLVWDFNGTILDDVAVCIRAANTLLSAHGLPTIDSPSAYRRLFGFPIVDYYRRLGFDFSVTPYDLLAREWVGYYLDFCPTATAYPGVEETAREIRAAGIPQIVLSATERSMLLRQLGEIGLDGDFDEVLGLDNIHAYSKEELGVNWRRNHPDGRVLMIGDTDHDAAVAAAMGADCILVSCGHQTREHLLTCPCLFVADDASAAWKRICK